MRFALASLVSSLLLATSYAAADFRYRVVTSPHTTPLGAHEAPVKIERVRGSLLLATDSGVIDISAGTRVQYSDMIDTTGGLRVTDLNQDGKVLIQLFGPSRSGVLDPRTGTFREYASIDPLGVNALEALNSSGVAVGSSYGTASGDRAYMSTPAGAMTLNSLLPSTTPRLSAATVINDQGVMVAEGRVDGSWRSFILMPTATGGYTVTPVALPPGTTTQPVEMYVQDLNNQNVVAISMTTTNSSGVTGTAAIIRDLQPNGFGVLAPPLAWMAEGENFTPHFISDSGIVVGSRWSTGDPRIRPGQYNTQTGKYRRLEDLTPIGAEPLAGVHAMSADGTALVAFVDTDLLGWDPDSPYRWRVLVKTCMHDYDGTGTTSIGDLFGFLQAFFSGDVKADSNGDRSITVQDIFDVLNSYFQNSACE